MWPSRRCRLPALPAGVSAAQASAYLRGQGFLVREASREDGVLVAAKKGAANKLGYFWRTSPWW